QLIDELQRDARIPVAELARRVALSPPSVTQRLRRLEEAGVIAGYRAVVDPRQLGYQLGVLIRIRPAPRNIAVVADIARQTPEVVECHRVTGDDCFVMTAYVRDVEHLEELIDTFTPHGQTTTSIMQSSPVPRRPLTPAAPAADLRHPLAVAAEELLRRALRRLRDVGVDIDAQRAPAGLPVEGDERHEALGLAADDREYHRQLEPRRAHGRLGAASDGQ